MRLWFCRLSKCYFRRSTNSAPLHSGTTFSIIRQLNQLQNNANQTQNVQCKEVEHRLKTSLRCFMAIVITPWKPKVNRFFGNNFNKSKVLHFAGKSIKNTQNISKMGVCKTEILSEMRLFECKIAKNQIILQKGIDKAHSWVYNLCHPKGETK